MMPSEVRDIRTLVRWLAKTYHRGAFNPMAARLGVSTALVYQWKDGTVRRPSDESIDRLCAAYGLEFWEVLALTRGKRRPSPISGRPISGGSAAPHPLPVAEPCGPQVVTHQMLRKGPERRDIMSSWRSDRRTPRKISILPFMAPPLLLPHAA